MSDRVGIVMEDRLRQIKAIIAAFEAGSISVCRAVSQIEEIAAGEHERIVHVGNTGHKPEINT